MKDNFLITTGGSGGHITPATIFCKHLLNKANIIISTDKRGLKYLDNENYILEVIDTPKMNNIFFLPYNFVIILSLIFKSFSLLKEKKIKKVFSTGGYMSLPIILAAKLLKIDIYLIEPNQILGRANRYFLRFCKKIFCYSDKIKNFPVSFEKKVVIINPLVKDTIYKLSLLPKKKDIFTLLIVGGSQGAIIFDNNLKNSIINISKKTPLRIIHQTNENNINNLSNFYSKYNVESKIFSFDKNFHNIIHQVDLCITRAGASTLAELSVLRIPFIAVPLPTSKDNHQFENANFYRNNNCCWIIEQNSFEEKIEQILEEILKEKTDYQKKKENLNKINYQNTWNNVNQKILENINEN
tara:strand:+ start:740 stop:1804 length:1065 start_codon:yes stop_codon:yes gene_type:complete